MTRKQTQRLDPLLRAPDELKPAIAIVVSHLEAREERFGMRTRKRKAVDRMKFHLAVEVLLSNFMVAYAQSPGTLLSIPLANGVLRGNARYRHVAFGKHFRDVIQLLEERPPLIQIVTRGFNVRSFQRREVTTIRPTAGLLKAFPPIVTGTRGSFTQIDPPETIILKNGDGDLIDYDETEESRRWRDEMQTINTYLRKASFSVTTNDVLLDDGGYVIRPHARTLRRIFSNGDWNQGGRLWDGFWETMKREERPHAIRINGEPIATVDFSQFNLRLAYTLAGQKSPHGDLYDVTGNDATSPDWPVLREGRKKLTNALINFNKPLRQWPGKIAEDRAEIAAHFPKGTTARKAIDDIKTKHHAIVYYFENARGHGFMRIESDILVATLLSLMKRGITALPLHDAVLVAERHAMTAKATMEREAKRRIGKAIPADIKMASG